MFDNLFVSAKMAAMRAGEKVKTALTKKSLGIDGILVTVGLCIIALVLIVVMKDQLAEYITTLVSSMTNKSQNILSLNN